MTDSKFQLAGFTFAIVDIRTMVKFYNDVFDCKLKPFQAFRTKLYRGQLAGFNVLFCPNKILEIEAKKNRIQLTLEVTDIEEVVQLVLDHGGGQMQEISETSHQKACGVTDPDGNSIELVQINKKVGEPA